MESNISLACGYCLQIKRLRATQRAACDLRAKNTVIPANASQCDHGANTDVVATESKRSSMSRSGPWRTAAMGNLNLEDPLQSHVLDGQFHEPNDAIEVG
jgi:hypothetical protein